MKVLLVAGSSPSNWPSIDRENYDYFVGIDRGSLYLIEKEWPLDLAVGDFDSLSEEEYQVVTSQSAKIHKAQSEKDDTDTQLALALSLEKFPQATVAIIGATGGRLDHFLSNLWLPLEPRFQPFIPNICFLDKQNSISYYLPGKHHVRKEVDMTYLAYVCLTPVTNLTLKESKYTLDHVDVKQPTSYASNEFIGNQAVFSFDSGVIAVIQSKDK